MDRKALLLLFGATLAWSTSGLFARAIPLDTPTVILWRGLFGAAGLLVTLLLMKGRDGLGDFARLGRAGWFYALCSGLGMLLFVGSLKATTIAHVAIIYATVPFAAAALGWLVLHERPSRVAMAASALALAGSAVMVGIGGDGRLIGDLMALGMAAAMATIIVIARARPEMPALAAGIVSAVWAPLACLPFASLAGVTPGNVALMAGFGLANSTLGFALFIYGSRRAAPVVTGLMGALETPLTPLWVWLVYAETPSAATLAGGALVMAAVGWFILTESRTPQP
ncbi:DMT family transporter [Tabrizicola oligotrophica]|uniref:DMT family transporter n=1 Tax=Tabrizicola oligotrophica TaxID=2710650 RepID=A0A6M0QTJ6_9RHOB|nr:DMT family transporter [Tabrizicola oligotrophica]NEY90727.1 DMT family transporter [Tabrizicola oligotrophica]